MSNQMQIYYKVCGTVSGQWFTFNFREDEPEKALAYAKENKLRCIKVTEEFIFNGKENAV